MRVLRSVVCAGVRAAPEKINQCMRKKPVVTTQRQRPPPCPQVAERKAGREVERYASVR